MVHVAALTEGGEIAIGIVGGVVIAVCCSQHDLGHANKAKILDRWEDLE